MKQNLKQMSTDEKIYLDLKEWVNHSKDAEGRNVSDYTKFEYLWKWLRVLYEKIMNGDNKANKIIASRLVHKGKIYRLHKKWNKNENMAGVKESEYYQSWSKSPNFSANIYWIYDDVEYLLIEATIPKNEFCIDLNGVCDSINQKLGTPAIENEQEIVFPIRYKDIDKISVVIFRKNSIIEKANYYLK